MPLNNLKQRKEITILIVDNDSISTILLHKLLERESYNVITLTSTKNLLPIIEEKRPDLIFLDVNLPEEKGSEICKFLKSNLSTATIPILFMSSDLDLKTKTEWFHAGGSDYVTKPFIPCEVITRVKTNLQLREAQKSLAKMILSNISTLRFDNNIISLPDPKEIPDANFACYHQITGYSGGFYDVIKTGEHIFDYIHADVCGQNIEKHKIHQIKTLINQNCNIVNNPSETLSMVNSVIPALLSQGQFLSITWIRIDRQIQKVSLINAGQPPILFIPKIGEVEKVIVSGDIIGTFDHVIFEQKDFKVERGDRFLLYSDSLIEIEGKTPQKRDLNIDKICKVCSMHKNSVLENFIDNIKQSQLHPVTTDDDIVLLGIEI